MEVQINIRRRRTDGQLTNPHSLQAMFSNIFETLLLSVLAIGLVEANLANQCKDYYLDTSQYVALRAQCTGSNGNTVSAFKWLDQCLWDDNGVLESGASPNGEVYVSHNRHNQRL